MSSAETNTAATARLALSLALTLALTVTTPGCGGAQRTEGPTGMSCAVGSWTGSGDDEGGTHWDFTLSLRESGPDLVGAFHWMGSDGSVGDEQIRGRVDCQSGTLDWQGESASGGSETMDVVTAHYTGTFDSDFRSFSATWIGGTPGTLRGARP